jgi:hypothetical protein
MLRLFTTSYPEADPNRAAEYALCLMKNIACRSIGGVYIIAENGGGRITASSHVEVRRMQSRPRYDDFFEWINEVAGDEDVSIIANSDIWFDDSILVAGQSLGQKQCIALARWDDDELFDRNDSQDCWMWRGKIPHNVRGDFPLGVPRCDNRLLHELRAAGYHVMNPAFSIKAHHVHAGAREDYAQANFTHFVDPPYGYLWPHNLWSLPRTIAHNLREPEHPLAWRLDRRRIAATLPARAAAKLARAILPRRIAA